MFPDYYRTLQIHPLATRDEIKKAYRKLALEFHPDRCASPNAHEKFIEINEAYLILYDTEGREKYDCEYKIQFAHQEYKENTDFSGNSGGFEAEDRFSRNENRFNDDDLNDWSEKARKQGTEYSKMAYDIFYKLVIGFVKETGFQFGNTLLVFIGILLTMSGVGNLIIGIVTGGDIGNPLLGVILLPIGLILCGLANKNWEKH